MSGGIINENVVTDEQKMILARRRRTGKIIIAGILITALVITAAIIANWNILFKPQRFQANITNEIEKSIDNTSRFVHWNSYNYRKTPAGKIIIEVPLSPQLFSTVIPKDTDINVAFEPYKDNTSNNVWLATKYYWAFVDYKNSYTFEFYYWETYHHEDDERPFKLSNYTADKVNFVHDDLSFPFFVLFMFWLITAFVILTIAQKFHLVKFP